VNVWFWLPVGLLMGAFNVASIALTVGRLRPEEKRSAVAAVALIAGCFVLRWIVTIFVLAVAFRQSAMAGLLAFSGLWLGRWTVLLYGRSFPPNRF